MDVSTSSFFAMSSIPAGWPAHSARPRACPPAARLWPIRLPRPPSLSAVGAAPAFAADEGADLILRGGTIRPLPGATVCSALAIKAGKVLAVGDESALSGLKTADTKVVDLAGRTLLPGLIDPHCHTLLASLIFELLDDVGYAKYPTREKVVAHLKAGRGEHATRAMDRWLGFRQSSARRGFHADGTGCDFNRSSDFRLVHQWARRLRQQRSA